MTRRDSLKLILSGGVAASFLRPWHALSSTPPLRHTHSGRLSFYNAHTQESAAVEYLGQDGRFDSAGLAQLSHLFRCHFTGDVYPIDPRLFLLLDAVQCRAGARKQTYVLISGYRSSEYNNLLRSKSRNVAKKSYHLRGMAADVRLDGVPMASLEKAAKRVKSGGVGSYPEFIHVDVGPVRAW